MHVTYQYGKYQMDESTMILPVHVTKSDGMHQHNFFELCYVVSGNGTHIRNGQSIRLRPGDMFMMDYEDRHRFVLLENEQMSVINVLFKPWIIDLSLSNCNSFSELCKNYFIRLNVIPNEKNAFFYRDEKGAFLPLLMTLNDEFHSDRIGKNELIRSLIIEVLIRFIRCCTNVSTYQSYHPCTVDIIRYIELHYTEHITLSDLSGALHYSISFLSKQFKNDVGMGFHHYLETVRIRQSRSLLLQTKLNVTEIAGLVGFSDVNRFYRVFQEIYHMTPGHYKKTMRNIYVQ